MAEFHAYNAKKFETLSEVNEQVKKFRKIHEDLNKLSSKIDSMLEDETCRMTASVRQRFVKTYQEIQNDKQLVARSIANLSN